MSTEAGEEGIDVPECQFVIHFSELSSTKSHIQRGGRARHKNAEIYYFENDPNSENRKAASVAAVARDTSLASTAHDFKLNAASVSRSTNAKHPYPAERKEGESGGTVTVFNSKEIFVRYIAKVMGQPINLKEELYSYSETLGQQQLLAIRYPTPDGLNRIERLEMMEFWKGIKKADVFCLKRSKNMSQAEKRERAFLYIVVVQLRKSGWLDTSNNPSDEAIELTKEKCPLSRTVTFDNGLSLKRRAVFTCDRQGTDLSLDNCCDILKNYFEYTMEQPINWNDLFVFHDDNHNKPATLKFPTSQGWLFKRYKDYAKLFQLRDLDDVFFIPGKQRVKAKEPRLEWSIAWYWTFMTNFATSTIVTSHR